MFLLTFFTMHRVPNKNVDRKQIPDFKIYGYKVCKKTFLYLLKNMSATKYRNIAKHYNNNGLMPREHGNKGRLPANTTPFDSTNHVTSFIKGYARDNALPLPGRVQGHREDTCLVISSSETKKEIWVLYSDANQEAGFSPVGYSLFLELWNTLLPWIVVAKPSTDLCWTCQKFSETLAATPNMHDDDKAAMVQEYTNHLNEARNNRRHYNNQIELAKVDYPKAREFSQLKKSEHCSFHGVANYSWDYAQQLHYPTNPQQPGPIYFKTARKCGIFGIANDGNGQQFNYLIDEAVASGKGASATISYVHHYLEHHGMGETTAYLHADNCSGNHVISA